MNFQEMSVAELKKVADHSGVLYGARASKQTLINALEKKMTENAPVKSKRELAEEAFLEHVKNEELTRADVIEKMIEASQCSKNLAVSLYPMFCEIHDVSAVSDRGTGKFAAFKVFKEYIDPENPPDDLQAARKAAFAAAKEASGLGDASLQTHMRNYLKMHGFELAGRPAAKATKEERTEFVKKQLDAGKTRSEVINALMDEFDYTENSAAGVYQSTIKDMGLAAERSGSEKRDQAWEWFKNNINAKRGEAFVAFAEMDISQAMAQNYWSAFSLAVTLAEDLTGQTFRVAEEEEVEQEAA